MNTYEPLPISRLFEGVSDSTDYRVLTRGTDTGPILLKKSSTDTLDVHPSKSSNYTFLDPIVYAGKVDVTRVNPVYQEPRNYSVRCPRSPGPLTTLPIETSLENYKK